MQEKLFEKHEDELKSMFDKLELEMESNFSEEKRKWAELRAKIAEQQLINAMGKWSLVKDLRAKLDGEDF